jgi:DNA-binding transcriptional ArsR family regulator
MGHGADGRPARARLDAATAKSVASTLQALATPSRLLILATLQEGPQTVGDLVEAVGMEQSAVSHQLRLLRTMGLVDSERHGRHIVYSLFDDHVSELIDQAIYHAEHVRMGTPDVAAQTATTTQ